MDPIDLAERIAELEAAVDRLGTRRRPPSTRGVRRLVLMATLVAAALFPAGAFATHIFSDVPTESTFHATIARIYGAGITTGCGPVTYCPNDPVTRGQMAAFLNRSQGRVAFDEGSPTLSIAGEQVIATVVLSAGNVGGRVGFVKVDANVNAAWNSGVCPCQVRARLWNSLTAEYSREIYLDITSGGGVGTFVDENGSLSWVWEVPTGELGTYELRAARVDGTASIIIRTSLVATYFPFSGDGGNTLAP